MENKYNIEEPEQLDALDQLIIDELGQQQRLRAMMRQWDEEQSEGCVEDQHTLVLKLQEQRRRQRRLRLVPIISNILSVAALMTVGFILQAVLPTLKATNPTPSVGLPPVVDTIIPTTHVATDTPLTIPTDTATAE